MRDCEVYKQFLRICHPKLLRNPDIVFTFFSLCIQQLNMHMIVKHQFQLYKFASYQIVRLLNCQVTKLSSYQIVRLPNCWLPNCLVTKLLGYQIVSYQNISYQ